MNCSTLRRTSSNSPAYPTPAGPKPAAGIIVSGGCVSDETRGTGLGQRRSGIFRRLYKGTKVVALRVWRPLTLCRVLGVPLQVHLTWLIYPAGFFLWLAYRSGREGVWLQVLGLLALLEASIVIHESGHVLVARRLGVKAERIVLIPFGGVALMRDMLRPPKELWIALAGPVTSLALAGLLYLALLPMSDPITLWRYPCLEVLRDGALLNLWIGLFNLIPCFPLDGGRILRSALYWLIRRFHSIGTQRANLLATRIAVRYVGWLLVGGLTTWMILNHNPGFHLIWFPLALCFAELEYWVLRDEASEDPPSDRSGTES